jgi:hypothetical protein
MRMERYLAMVVRRYRERKEWRRKINEGFLRFDLSTELKSWRGLVP